MGSKPLRVLLDTHVWVWWHMNPARLSDRVRRLLSDPGRCSEVLLSAISPWEFAMLVAKGRLGISCDPETWVERAMEMPKMRLVPLSPRIASRSTTLPPPFHSDPADRIIVATAREEGAVILTSDERIRRYPHARSLW